MADRSAPDVTSTVALRPCAGPSDAATTAVPRTQYPPLIGFTPNTWSYGWSSRRRLLLGLAEHGWPTMYSSGSLTVWDIESDAWRHAPLTHQVKNHGRLLYDTPGKLMARWPGRSWDTLALASYTRHLRRAFPHHSRTPPIALLFHPAFWPYVKPLRPAHVVYYPYDAHSLAPGWTSQFAAYERELVASASLIAGFSRGMLDVLPGDGPARGRVLPTGVDVAAFATTDALPCPADLAIIPRPRIGYAGRINQKLDYARLLELATRRPDWHWVFVGDVGSNGDGRFATDRQAEALWHRCLSLPNVHTLGKKPHREMPRYLRHMDVNTMCYRTDDNGWWSKIFPLKSMEYLACGQPIVSAPVTTMLPFADVIAIATTSDDWIGAISDSLGGGGVGTTLSRRACAGRNTWDQRVDRLHGWLLGALAGKT